MPLIGDDTRGEWKNEGDAVIISGSQIDEDHSCE